MNRTLRVQLGSADAGAETVRAVRREISVDRRRRPIELRSKQRSIAQRRSRRHSRNDCRTCRGFDPDNRLLALEDLGARGGLHRHLSQRSAVRTRTRHHCGDTPARCSTGSACCTANAVAAAERPMLDNRAMRALNHAHIFDIPLRADNGIDLDAITPGSRRTRARAVSDDAQLRQRVAALGAIYLGEAPHASTPALLHGDYYPGSWLRHPRLGVAIIDPEFAFHRPAGIRRRRADRALHVRPHRADRSDDGARATTTRRPAFRCRSHSRSPESK